MRLGLWSTTKARMARIWPDVKPVMQLSAE
jgi:hypothetical protein